MTKNRVFAIGVGMTKFEKPGIDRKKDYLDFTKEAVSSALNDCNLTYKQIQHATVGYVYGDSSSGQAALYDIGLTGIPIINVNNNCATGSTALFISKQLIEGGIYDCVLALGFEKMSKGALTPKFTDRLAPIQRHANLYDERYGIQPLPITVQLFGQAGLEHMAKYGSKQEHFAKIAYKNHKHSINNPYSQLQNEISMEEILNPNDNVFEFLTKLQCCPISNGAAAAILASEKFVKQNNLEHQAVEILAMEMATDVPSTFETQSAIKLVGYDMTKIAAEKAYNSSGVQSKDIDVIELHDCFTSNELISYSALKLCEEGKEHEIVEKNDNTYNGKWVINPSGGLLSKGHPLGSTGLAQCCELSWQLRGKAEKRQVQNAKLALQHNIGLGGAAIVAIYKLGFPEKHHISKFPSKL